jgi:hypothetical protein
VSDRTTRAGAGIEELLAVAASDPELAAALLRDRGRFLADNLFELSPAERRLLEAIPAEALERMLSGVAAAQDRRTFLQQSTGTMLGLFGGGGGGGIQIGGATADRPHTRTSSVDVKIGALNVGPSLSVHVVRRIIRAHLNEVRYYFERELRRPSPPRAIKATLLFTVNLEGKTADASCSSTVKSEALEQALVRAVLRWLFSKPTGKPARVTCSFVYVTR